MLTLPVFVDCCNIGLDTDPKTVTRLSAANQKRGEEDTSE